jgi:calmodulin
MSAKDLLNDPDKLEEIAKAAFKAIDTNGNGEIDRNELKKGLSHLSDTEISNIMKQFDVDKNGKISYQEFKQNIKQIIEDLI